jgi:hypothetical protein
VLDDVAVPDGLARAVESAPDARDLARVGDHGVLEAGLGRLGRMDGARDPSPACSLRRHGCPGVRSQLPAGTPPKSTIRSARSAGAISSRCPCSALSFTGAARKPPSLSICQTSTSGMRRSRR